MEIQKTLYSIKQKEDLLSNKKKTLKFRGYVLSNKKDNSRMAASFLMVVTIIHWIVQKRGDIFG